jgi:hypothetical protein
MTKRVGGYSASLRHRIHPNGWIVGGLHDKGMKYADASRRAGLHYFSNQEAAGNLAVERKKGKIRYRVKRLPFIPFGSPNELGLLRAQHFIKENENTWIQETKFKREFAAIYDNLVDHFKFGA